MQITFYATEEDELDVWRVLFAVPGMRILETHSRPGQPLREFATLDELRLMRENEPHTSVAAAPSSVGGLLLVEEITFARAYAVRCGHQGRQILRSPFLINFRRNNPQNGCLSTCCFSAWSEAGARDRSMHHEADLDQIDWKKFTSIVRRLKYQIEKISPARFRSMPVLPDAFRRMKSGELLLWGFGEEISISSPSLVIKGAKLH